MTVIYNLTCAYSRRRFACLFFSLLITMVAAPVFGAMGLSTRFMEILLALNILAAVLITQFSLQTYVGLGLLALVLAARVGQALLGYGSLLETSQGLGAVICLASMFIMLRFILSEGYVTSERIFAALNVPSGGHHMRTVLLHHGGTVDGVFFFSGVASRRQPTKFAGAYDLLQLRDAGNAGLWRHHTHQRPCPRAGGYRSYKRSNVSGRGSSASGQSPSRGNRAEPS